MMHEIREQYSKRVNSKYRKFDKFAPDHQSGINFENSVNGNKRLMEIAPIRGDGVIERFELSNGTVVRYKVTGGPNSPTQKIITVTPLPSTKK